MRERDVVPVTPERWDDLQALFGDRGAYAGCWCQWWRMTASGFDGAGAAARRERLAQQVAGGCAPGLLCYEDGEPVGWVSAGARSDFGRVERSRRLATDTPAEWAVVCFYVPRAQRGRGIARTLLAGAVEHARRSGAAGIEGYPITPPASAAEAYTGVPSLFAAARFVQVTHGTRRTVWRRELAEA